MPRKMALTRWHGWITQVSNEVEDYVDHCELSGNDMVVDSLDRVLLRLEEATDALKDADEWAQHKEAGLPAPE